MKVTGIMRSIGNDGVKGTGGIGDTGKYHQSLRVVIRSIHAIVHFHLSHLHAGYNVLVNVEEEEVRVLLTHP